MFFIQFIKPTALYKRVRCALLLSLFEIVKKQHWAQHLRSHYCWIIFFEKSLLNIDLYLMHTYVITYA